MSEAPVAPVTVAVAADMVKIGIVNTITVDIATITIAKSGLPEL